MGVTYISHYQLPDDDQSYLISGDEEGTLIVWDLSTFKQVAKYVKISKSIIQSIKDVNIIVGDRRSIVLVVQSRNDGVQVLDFHDKANRTVKLAPNVLASYPTHDSLFSRGDALSTRDGSAILAHPSLLENHLVTIRVLGRDAKTVASGTAGQDKHIVKKFPLFDIKIIKNSEKAIDEERYHLFTAHEDGFMHIHEFQLNTTKTVPFLNSEGIDVKLTRRIDLGFKDFVAAYDIIRSKVSDEDDDNYLIVAGSPGKYLCFMKCSAKFDAEPDIHRIRLRTNGVSAISLSPDMRFVAVASWDKSVKLFSTEEHKLLAKLDQHTKQVQAILFAPKPATSLMDLSLISEAGYNNKQMICCASQDGTISISSTV